MFGQFRWIWGIILGIWRQSLWLFVCFHCYKGLEIFSKIWFFPFPVILKVQSHSPIDSFLSSFEPYNLYLGRFLMTWYLHGQREREREHASNDIWSWSRFLIIMIKYNSLEDQYFLKNQYVFRFCHFAYLITLLFIYLFIFIIF